MSNPSYTEVEAKFYIADLVGVETRLEAEGAELVQARAHQHNLRFDRLDGELHAAHKVLRLRQDDQASITYKGPNVLEDGVFRRDEIEFEIADFEAAKKLLEALWYQTIMVNEKYRTTYSLWGLLWMLDELPLGKFLEIEGRHPQDIQAAAIRLGLDWEARLQHGYYQLFARAKEALGLDLRDLTFANFEGVEVSAQVLGVASADG